MATPLTATALLNALRGEGVKAVEYKSWRTHQRDSATGKPFGTVNGVTIHHTAGSNSLALVYDGRPDLPGPLANAHLSKAGVTSMCSAGRANHAGTFAQNAHDAVVRESAVHPRPDSAEPVDGNDHYYGLEIENLGDGKDPYPSVQYDQAVRWAAGICRAYGWTANSVIGHKEGTRRKIDPSFDMGAFRARVAERLAHPASWTPKETAPVATTVPTPAQIADAVWADKLTGGTTTAEAHIVQLTANVAALTAKVNALPAAAAVKAAVLEALASGTVKVTVSGGGA